MRRRRRRGGPNCGRALIARKALKSESTDLVSEALKNVGQLHPQETKEEPSMNWHFRRNQDVDELTGLLKRRRAWKTRRGIKPENEPHMNLSPSKKKSRPRNIRFSNVENMTLISKLVPVYEQLLGQCKSRTPLLKRSQMWQEICDAVNSAGNKQRFVHHCKKRFNDIKRQLRNKLNREKSLLADHARPSAFQVYYTQYEEELKKVLPAEVIDGIEFFDSDHPQELYPEEEAGPSWCTPQNGQQLLRKEKSLPELQNISEPEALQRPLYSGLLDEQWSVLPDLGSTFPLQSGTVRSMKFPTDHVNLHLGHPVDLSKPKLHLSRRPLPCYMPKPTCNHGAHLLKVLKATQKLFQKSMMHSLNVLRSDVGYFKKCINESNSIAHNLLRVENERNNILDQMNIQLGRLAESVDQLANQQQVEHILLHEIPRKQNPRQTLSTPLRGERIGASHQAREVRCSLRITS